MQKGIAAGETAISRMVVNQGVEVFGRQSR